MRRQLIIFSAPKGVGKDTAIAYMSEIFDFKIAECKEHLFKLTKAFFNLTDEEFDSLYYNRENKESFVLPLKESEVAKLAKYSKEPQEPRSLISIREALIYVSEIIYKPIFGEDIFGKIRVENAKEPGLYVDGSYGFQEELEPAIEAFGRENILAIRLHCNGYNYDGDSRSYIPEGLVKTLDVTTERGKVDELGRDVNHIVYCWLTSFS